MNFPGRNQRGADPYQRIARGEQLTADYSRAGVVDDGNLVWPERIDLARRTWPEARASDFEQLDRRGRRWRDRVTGREFTAAQGAPLLTVGSEQSRGIQAWFVRDGRFVFLRSSEWSDTVSGPAGYLVSRRLDPPPAPAADSMRIH